MPKDDWKPLKSTLKRPLHPQVEKNFRDFGFLNIRWEWEQGRFTPLYNIIQIGEAQVFRNRPALWQMETLAIGIAAAYLFYAVLVRLGFSFLPALLSSLWFLGRGQDLWVEKQFQEGPGMLFIMLALFFFVRGAQRNNGRRNDWMAVGFMALAGLMKETFVILYPALIAFRMYLSRFHFESMPPARIIRELRWPFSAAAALFLLEMGIISYVFREGLHSRAIVGNPTSFSMSGISAMIKSAAGHLAYFVPALGLLLLIPRLLRDKPSRRQYAGILTIILLWVVSQILIYKNTGWSGHYIFPALAGLIFLNSLGLETLRRAPWKWAHMMFWVVAVFTGLAIGRLFPVARNPAERKAAVAESYTAAARRTFQAIRSQSAVLMISDRPWWGIGMTYLMDLSRQGLDCQVYYDYPAFDLKETKNPAGVAINVDLLSRSMYRLGPETATRIDVIFSVYPEKEFLRIIPRYYPWFCPQDWTVHPFPVLYSRFRPLGFFPWLLSRTERSEEYTVWVRKSGP